MKDGNLIQQLQTRGDTYARRIFKEQKRLEKMQVSVQAMQKEIWQLRQQKANSYSAFAQPAGATNTNHCFQQLRKETSILENRLNKVLIRQNEAETSNKELKEKIDLYRTTLIHRETMRKKLELELRTVKENIEHALEESNVVMQEKDELLRNLSAVNHTAEEEEEYFEKKSKELEDYTSSENKLCQEYLASVAKNVTHQSAEVPAGFHLGEMTMHQENSILRIIEDLKKEVRIGRNREKELVHKLEAYDEAFASLQEAHRARDMDRVIADFLETEQEIFAIYDYIQRVGEELSETEDEIASIGHQTSLFSGQAIDGNTKNQQSLGEKNKFLKSLTEASGTSRESEKKSKQMVSRAGEIIHMLYTRLQLNNHKRKGPSSSLQALRDPYNFTSSGHSITEYNILEYWAEVEKDVLEVLQTTLRHPLDRVCGPSSPPSKRTSMVILENRSWEHHTSEDEESEGPVSIKELKRNTQKLLKDQIQQLEGLTKPMEAISSDDEDP